MALQSPSSLIQELVATINQQHFASVATLVAPGVVVNGQVIPRTEFTQALRRVNELVPGRRVTAEVVYAQGAWVFTHWTTHRAAAPAGHRDGAPPQIRRWTGVRLFRTQHGQVVEVWYQWTAIERFRALQPDSSLPLPHGYRDL